MGIKGFYKWLIIEFPEILVKDKKAYPRCNTLFIDLCQLSFASLELVNRKFKELSKSEQIDFLNSDFIKRVKNTILKINPADTIFAFLDGPNPAIKFQRQRERWFKREHIDNYIIDATEYKLSDVNTDLDEKQIIKLEELFQEITHNCKYLKARRILFSTFYAPGEAEHKFLEVFRNFKQKQFWKSNQLHSIYTTDNDLIFLSLQFLDEHFIIYRDLDTIIDISILRDLLLYRIFQDQNLCSKENRLLEAQNLISRIPINLQQQVINDIIALSFIVGNDYLPPIPDFSALFSFSNLLNSYKKINKEYFAKIIANDKDTNDKVSFSPLIINDCICVSSLQKIIHECFNCPIEKSTPILNSEATSKSTNKNSIINKDEASNTNEQKTDDKSIPHHETDTNQELPNDNDNNNGNNNNNDNNNNNINDDNRKNSQVNDTNNTKNDNENDNNNDNSSTKNNDSENKNSNLNDNKNDDDDNSLCSSTNITTISNLKNEPLIQNSGTLNDDDNESQNHPSSKLKSKPQADDFTDLQEASQQMLRVFNFTWLYYTKGCPSWSFYYPFKKSPKLREAINFMKQEGPQVFKTEGFNEKTEPIFKTFVLHPAETKENLPFCIYKLKIPPSEISHFWPLGAKNVCQVPVFDLALMKKFYNEEKKNIKKEELKYNRVDPLYITYKNMNNNNRNHPRNGNYKRFVHH